MPPMFSTMSFLNIYPVLCRLRIGNKCFIEKAFPNKDYRDNIVRNYGSERSEKYLPIQDFYAGKSVFLTGCTGFLGKVILERLLHTCTELDKVYLFVRNKNGVPFANRIQNIFENPLFDTIKKEIPESLNKVVPIMGDLTEPDMGIKADEIKILSKKVSIIFHSAASVLFNASWDVNLKNNFEGTKNVLNLCRKFEKLETVVHVSTAYASVRHKSDIILEEIYPSPAKIEEVYDFAKKFNNDQLKTKEFVGAFGNNYAFVKALSESNIAKNYGNIPICVVRPSIVCAKSEDPQAGWMDKIYTLTGPLMFMATGWNRVSPGKKKLIPDIIPVDYVANTCIVAAARFDKSKNLQVYNSCSSGVNPITWGEAYKFFSEDTVKRGLNEFPMPFIIFVERKSLRTVLTFLLQLLPAHLADVYLRIRGKQPRYVKIEKKIIYIMNSIDFYLSNSWIFKSENVTRLHSSLSERDRKLFPCDAAEINWRDYFHTYSKGVYKYPLSGKKTNKLYSLWK